MTLSTEDQLYAAFIVAVLDPNLTDKARETLADELEQAILELDLPPKEQRAQNLTQVLCLLSEQNPKTTEKELIHYANQYYDSLEVARLVARHPAVSMYLLAQFTYFLPDDAQNNPNFVQYNQDEKWERHHRNSKPYQVTSRWGDASLKSSKICKITPWRFKVDYWLQHGDAADKRFILALDNVSEQVVTPYLTDKSAHLRKAIASRGNLSVELAQKLGLDKAKSVRQTLAENQKCPPEVLIALIKDKDEAVQQSALKNTACPADAVVEAKLAAAAKPAAPVKAAHELSDQQMMALLADPATNSSALKGLADINQDYVKGGVALHKNCPDDIFTRLASDPSTLVKQCVAFNPQTPSQTLQTLLDENNSDCHEALASNPALSEQQQLQLVQISDDKVRMTLADTTDLETVWIALRDSPPTIKTLAKKQSWRDSISLLLDPTSSGLFNMQRRFENRSLFFAKMMARHPKCTESLFEHYAYYQYDALAHNPQIALMLLENPNAIRPAPFADWKLEQWLSDCKAPGYVADYYLSAQSAVDNVKYCRKAVENVWASLRMVQPHVFHPDILLRKKIAQKRGNTLFMFEVLARDKKESVRECLAKNAQCPAQTLALLATDKVTAIVVAAKQNKNFDAKLVKKSDNKKTTEALKNKGPKRNRIRMAQEAKALSVLRDLAGDKLAEVRLSVVENEKTPLDVLQLLASDEDEDIRYGVTKHENATTQLLQSLFGDPSAKVRCKALNKVTWVKSTSLETLNENHDDYDWSNRTYDEPTLAQFYQDDDEYIQQLIARHTSDVDVQQAIAQTHIKSYCQALARNITLDPTVADLLIDAGEHKTLKLLIGATHNEQVYFKTLAASPDLAERLHYNDYLIKQPNIQAKLIDHPDPNVRSACSTDATDSALLMKLATDGDDNVRKSVCYNKKLKKAHVVALLSNPTTDCLNVLQSHNNRLLSPLIGELLTCAPMPIRKYIARNFEKIQKWEKALCEDPAYEVRKALVSNWSLPEQTMKLLEKDSDERVRNEVAERYKDL